ncbi:MAG: riboflavin biosynthesis protein RibF [Bacteriovoracaceae bacterium]|jgi:riboflavin kinase/FMN adenylyltransferase|nr:riboflavin biosynthesis protein RibF [Bacteriovoracaceae bacterium]
MSKSIIIGNFDGGHLGHRYLLSQYIEMSRAFELDPIILTYDMHPKEYFNGDLENFFLFSYKSKIEFLKEIAHVDILKFKEIASLSALDFFKRMKNTYPTLTMVFTGYDTKFGKDKVSDFNFLSKETGLVFKVLKKYEPNAISSTYIRDAVKSGKFEDVEKMLGRVFSLKGMVVKGKQIGRTIGFATANIFLDIKLCRPNNGVYCGYVTIGEVEYIFVANLGRRPSIDDDESIILEAHIVGFNGDIYNQNIELNFKHKIRNVVKFETLDALKAQIAVDIEKAKTLLC